MRHSLQHRLILATLGVSAAVYLVSAGAFYLMLHQSAYSSVRETLSNQLELVKGMLEKDPADEHEPEGKIELELSEVRRGKYVERFSGRYFVVQVPGQPPILSPSLGGRMPGFAAHLPIESPNPQFLDLTGPLNEPLMVVVQTIHFEQKHLLLSVAEPLTQTRQWLQRILTVMAVGLPVSLAGLLLILWWMLRQALGPLNRLVKEIENLDAQSRETLQLEHFGLDRELHELASAFNRLLGRISHVRAAEAQLLQDVSHQLKTPVTVILSTCDVMLQRLRAPEMYQEALDQIRQTGASMRQLLNRLLSVAHLDAENRRALQARALELNELVSTAIGLIQPLADSKEIGIDFVPGDALSLEGDSGRLTELLLILLENALIYSPAGSRIRVGVTAKPGWAQLSVRDQGPGIPAEDLPHLFERFYRGARATQTEGTGLGLAIAEQIVALHAGRIEAHSRADGAEFLVALPLARTAETAHLKPSSRGYSL